MILDEYFGREEGKNIILGDCNVAIDLITNYRSMVYRE